MTESAKIVPLDKSVPTYSRAPKYSQTKKRGRPKGKVTAIRNDYFLALHSEKENGYQVVHCPTKQSLFTCETKEIANKAIEYLIATGWDWSYKGALKRVQVSDKKHLAAKASDEDIAKSLIYIELLELVPELAKVDSLTDKRLLLEGLGFPYLKYKKRAFKSLKKAKELKITLE